MPLPHESLLPKEKYNLIPLRISTSTQISNRTSAVLSHLQQAAPQGKPTIVALAAPSKASSKLISIVEIAKRELGEKKCFQYTALHTETVRLPDSGEAHDDEDGEERAFEAMPGAIGTGRRRKVPVLTIYLSTTSVRELKAAYG